MKKNSKPNSIKIRALTILVVTLCFLAANEIQSSKGQNNNIDASAWSMHLFSSRPTNGTTTDPNVNFSPFEIVQLSANITHQGEPRANSQVAFKIVGPNSSTYPTTIIRTAGTDQNGTATTSFRIPANNNPENPVLGTWQALCTAATTDQTLRDNITFSVSLPIIVRSIRLLDHNGTDENNFSTGQTVKVQINIQNIRIQPINSNIEMNVTDSESARIGQINLQNQKLDSATNIIESEFLIPDNASSGQATIDLKVFSIIEGQSEQISEPTTATIIIEKPVVEERNVAITEAHLSSNQLTKGQPLTVTMTASNNGSKTENATISINYNQNLAGSITTELTPQQQKTLVYVWNTTDISIGTYQITAHIDAVDGEKQPNNSVTAGTFTLTAALPPEQTTSLFILTLFITGVTTFTLLLAFLRKKGAQPPRKNIDRNTIQNRPPEVISQAQPSSLLTAEPKITIKEKFP